MYSYGSIVNDRHLITVNKLKCFYTEGKNYFNYPAIKISNLHCLITLKKKNIPRNKEFLNNFTKMQIKPNYFYFSLFKQYCLKILGNDINSRFIIFWLWKIKKVLNFKAVSYFNLNGSIIKFSTPFYFLLTIIPVRFLKTLQAVLLADETPMRVAKNLISSDFPGAMTKLFNSMILVSHQGLTFCHLSFLTTWNWLRKCFMKYLDILEHPILAVWCHTLMRLVATYVVQFFSNWEIICDNIYG